MRVMCVGILHHVNGRIRNFPLAMLLEWGMVYRTPAIYKQVYTPSHIVYHVRMLSQQLQLASSAAVNTNLEMHGNSITCTIEKMVVRQQC